MEIWQNVVNFDWYQVSNYGRVRSLRFDKVKILKPGLSAYGYHRVFLTNKISRGKNFLVHRLVATAFIPNCENKPEINHIDGNKTNNCISNLEWCDRSENIQHAYDTGLKISTGNIGDKHGKYNHNVYNFYHQQHGKIEATQYEFTKKFGFDDGNVSKLITGKSKSIKGWRISQ